MDGNGRWAQKRGKERFEGHIAGVESVRRALQYAAQKGIQYLTLYAFSTENWGRPQEEVDALMELMCHSISNEAPSLKKNGVRVKVIGYRAALSEKVRGYLDFIEGETSQCDRITLVLALNYSSRNELMRAMKGIAADVASGSVSLEDVGEELISSRLDSSFMPDPDLIIRTSGECRLSNFLLWQASYSEFYFSDVLWPDFDDAHFEKALEEYAGRGRRYGKI